jgi:integrase
MTKTDALKRVVEAWGDETERSFRMGDVPAERGRGLTVQQWHDRWIKARNVAATTAHEERLRLDRYVLPRWGSWPLRSIGRIDVQAWVTDLGRERGAHVAFGCYSGAAEDAHRRRARGLPDPVTPVPEDRPAEARAAGAAVADARGVRPAAAGLRRCGPQGDQWRAMVAVACNSGLRSGELAGLDVGARRLRAGLVIGSIR